MKGKVFKLVSIFMIFQMILTMQSNLCFAKYKKFEFVEPGEIRYLTKNINIPDYRERIYKLQQILEKSLQTTDGEKDAEYNIYDGYETQRMYAAITTVIGVRHDLGWLFEYLYLKSIIKDDAESENIYYYNLYRNVHTVILGIKATRIALKEDIKLFKRDSTKAKIDNTLEELQYLFLGIETKLKDFNEYISEPAWIEAQEFPPWYNE